MKIHLVDGAEVVMDDAIIMPRDHAQAYALSLPGAYAEHPWGQTVIKVKRKVFLFVNGAIAPQDGVSLSVKLPQSGADVLELPLAEPMGYGMGMYGWVTLLIMRNDQLPLRLLEAWIDESYRAVAPKRLLTELDAVRNCTAVPTSSCHNWHKGANILPSVGPHPRPQSGDVPRQAL